MAACWGDHLLSPRARDILLEDGFTMVLWNSIPRDWEQPDGWVETALEHCEGQDWTVMVLHDIPTGAMRRLGRFIDEARDRGIAIKQEISPACVSAFQRLHCRPDIAFRGKPGSRMTMKELADVRQRGKTQSTPCGRFRWICP